MKEEDNRNTTRHDSKSMCEVSLDSEVYRGPVIDCSDGIGVILKNSRHVVKGTQAHIKVLYDNMELEGEIIWTEELDSEFVRIGFRNIGNNKDSPTSPGDFGDKVSDNESAGKGKGPGEGEDQSIKGESLALSEEIAVAADEEAVRGCNGTDEGITEEVNSHTVRAESNSAGDSEKRRRKKRWPYLIAVLFLAVLVGISVILVRDKNTKPVSIIAKAPLDIPERRTPYPSFAQDALIKLERE